MADMPWWADLATTFAFVQVGIGAGLFLGRQLQALGDRDAA